MSDSTWWEQPTTSTNWDMVIACVFLAASIVALALLALSHRFDSKDAQWPLVDRAIAAIGFAGVAFATAYVSFNPFEEGTSQAVAASSSNLEAILADRYGATVRDPAVLEQHMGEQRPDQIGPVALELPGEGLAQCLILTPEESEGVRAVCGFAEPALAG